MTLEQLLKLGYTQEQAEQLLKLHNESISGNYIPKHRFDEVNTELGTLKTQLSERDVQIGNLKKFEGDNESLKKTISELQEQNTQKENEYKATIQAEKKKNAVKLTLLEDKSKPHDVDMVMGLINMDLINLDDKGIITSGLKEQIETLKKDKSFLFNEIQQQDPQTNNSNNSGWKFFGQNPKDGDKNQNNNQPSQSESFGKMLAQAKLGMLGIQNNTNQGGN